MKTKDEFESWYLKENPWGFVGTSEDKIRREIFHRHLSMISSRAKIQSVLDMGCGEGHLSAEIIKHFDVPIDAFDISDKALDYARRINARAKVNYFQLDMNDFEPRKKYDLIICEEALYYLSDDERLRVMKKINEALNDGGFLKLSVVSVGVKNKNKYFTPHSIEELVQSCGFSIEWMTPSVVYRPGKMLRRFLFSAGKKAASFSKSEKLLKWLTGLTLSEPIPGCYMIALSCRKISGAS